MLKVIGTALLTAVVTSFFWIWFYNFVPTRQPSVGRSGNLVTVKPDNAPPVVVAEQVTVAPSGLAIPVTGIKADLIVVGHRHLDSWAARWWRGSISKTLIEHAPCSVLVAITR